MPARICLPQDKARVERLELFDEFEEWHMIQDHYCIVVAVNEESDGSSSDVAVAVNQEGGSSSSDAAGPVGSGSEACSARGGSGRAAAEGGSLLSGFGFLTFQ